MSFDCIIQCSTTTLVRVLYDIFVCARSSVALSRNLFLKFCSVTEVTYFYSQRCYDYCLSSTFVYYLQKPDIKMHFFKFHLIYIPKCMCWQSFSFVFRKLSKLQAPYKVAVTKKVYIGKINCRR